MTRTAAGLCVASAFALAATLGAQQQGLGAPARNDGTTTTADFEQTPASRAGAAASDRVTLTGCLDRSPNGTYVLNKARLDLPGAGTSATTGSTGGTTAGSTTGSTAGTTAGTAATGTAPGTSGSAGTTPATTTARGAGTAARDGIASTAAQSTWTLQSSSDLAPHVGHQVQIVGRAAGSQTGRAAAGQAGSTAATAGTTGTTGSNTTAGTTGSTSGTTAPGATSTTTAPGSTTASSTTGAATTTGGSGTPAGAATGSGSVEVESLRMIASSCA